jgi:hypothetical protein
VEEEGKFVKEYVVKNGLTDNIIHEKYLDQDPIEIDKVIEFEL